MCPAQPRGSLCRGPVVLEGAVASSEGEEGPKL